MRIRSSSDIIMIIRNEYPYYITVGSLHEVRQVQILYPATDLDVTTCCLEDASGRSLTLLSDMIEGHTPYHAADG
jgi:hypothetical protein